MPGVPFHHPLPLPRGWPRHVRSAVVQAISLAGASMAATRGWAVDSMNTSLRRRAEVDHLEQEVRLLREEMRIKDTRMQHVDVQKRPHYPPTERLAILELRAARSWSLAQTARSFLVTPLTIASWTARVDEDGVEALVRLPEPVNRFPDFVGYIVRRLKVLCPAMGRVRIARVLARAGLHLGPTTIRRMLRPARPPKPLRTAQAASRAIPARKPNDLWHVDLTTVPTCARVLDFVGSLRPASSLAVLLVGGRRHRPLLAARHRIRGLPWPAILPCRSRVPGAALPGGGPSAPISRLRPGPAVCRTGVQTLVPPSRHPAALRGHRPVRQPRRDRALHPNSQERVHPAIDSNPVPSRRHAARAGGLRLLVQRPPASHPTRRRHSRRGLPSPPSGIPSAAFRTPPPVATPVPVRHASDSHPWPARSRA